MLSIANKLGWNGKPVTEVVPTIKQMVTNQQSLELDAFMYCSDFEKTLTAISTFDRERLIETLYVDSLDALIECWETLTTLTEGQQIVNRLCDEDEAGFEDDYYMAVIDDVYYQKLYL